MSAQLPEPPVPFQARAKADYPARSNIEINLQNGAVYTVTQTDGKGLWWQARDLTAGNVGWFPASFVDVIKQEAAPPPNPLPPPPAAQPVQPVQARPVGTDPGLFLPTGSGGPSPAPVKPQPPTPVATNPAPVKPQPPTPVATNPAPVKPQPPTPVSTNPAPVKPQPPAPGGGASSPGLFLPSTPSAVPSVAAPPVVSQPVAASAARAASPPQQQRALPTEKPPAPSKETKDKSLDTAKMTLKFQIVDTTIGEAKKSYTAFLCRQSMYDPPNKCVEVGKTKTLKKDKVNLNFNELFHIIINDPEEDLIILRFCSSSKLKTTGKELIGEVSFSLRGSARDFNAPYYQFKQYPVLKDKKEIGKAQIFIEFTDTRVYRGPTNFEHKSHLGYDPATGKFDTKNIPPEWKKMFANVGIKPSHLQSPDTAAKIFSIMESVDLNAAPAEAGAKPPPPPAGASKASGGPPPPPPAGASKASGGPPPPPPPGAGAPRATGGPPPPAAGAPPPKATGGPPPPTGGPPPPTGGPPPPGGGPPKLGGPPPPGGGPPPPKVGGPPPPASGGPPPPAAGGPPAPKPAASFGMGDLASQLAAGKAGLHSAESRPLAEKPPLPSPAAPSLEDALRDAMKGFRPAIEGQDEWSNDEDWSD